MNKLETNLNPEVLSKNHEEFKRFLIALSCMENYLYQNRYQIDILNRDYPSIDKK